MTILADKLGPNSIYKGILQEKLFSQKLNIQKIQRRLSDTQDTQDQE